MADLALFLLLANALSAVLVGLRELLRRGGYVSLPFLTSIIFLTWYLPQAWALLDDPSMNQGSLARLFLMSLLCFWAIIFGWRRGLRRGWRRPERLVLPIRNLILPVLAITLLAGAMSMLIEMQPPAIRALGQWTGVITIIAFFGSVGVVSMVLSTAMLMQSRSFATLALFAMNLALYLPKLLIYFRRADAFEFILATLLGFLFIRQRAFSRGLIILGAIAGFFFINGVGHLRDLGGGYTINNAGEIETRIPTFAEILAIDWLLVADSQAGVEISEVRNAAVFLEALSRQGYVTLGAQLWNSMISAYLPGQLVGHDFKAILMIGDSADQVAQSVLGYSAWTGTTSTGFVAPYHDFWFFGFIAWWVSGFVMGRFMYHALRGGVLGYVIYASTITNAIHITTHSGYYLLSQSVLILIAIMFVRLFLNRSVTCSNRNHLEPSMNSRTL